MSEYPKAKMPEYGDGPEPCEDCAIKDKRIVELEDLNANLTDTYNKHMHSWGDKYNELEAENTQVCEWWTDDDPDMWGDSGLWESTCGVAYQFTAGGPTENNHKYCHKCGKPIHISEGDADE